MIHPSVGPIRQVGALLAGQMDATTLPVPDFSQSDTEEVLAAIGVDPETLTSWMAEGAIA